MLEVMVDTELRQLLFVLAGQAGLACQSTVLGCADSVQCALHVQAGGDVASVAVATPQLAITAAHVHRQRSILKGDSSACVFCHLFLVLQMSKCHAAFTNCSTS